MAHDYPVGTIIIDQSKDVCLVVDEKTFIAFGETSKQIQRYKYDTREQMLEYLQDYKHVELPSLEVFMQLILEKYYDTKKT